VASMWDLSQNGRHMIQRTTSKRPTYETAGLNGYPCFSTDGADDNLASLPAVVTINSPQTIAWLVRPTVALASGSSFPVSMGPSTTAARFQWNSSTSLMMNAGVGLTLGNMSAGANHILIGVFNGTSSIGNLDGVETTGNAGSQAVQGRLALGSVSGGTSNFLSARFGPVLVYRGIADATMRAAIIAWFKAGYGLP